MSNDGPSVVTLREILLGDETFFKDKQNLRTSTAGEAYLASMDKQIPLQCYQRFAASEGHNLNQAFAEEILRCGASSMLHDMEMNVLMAQLGDSSSDALKIERKNKSSQWTDAAFEQMASQASDWFSTFSEVAEDTRQLARMCVGMHQENPDLAKRAQENAALSAQYELQGFLLVTFLKDSQQHEYFRETYGDHRVILAATVRKLLCDVATAAIDIESQTDHFFSQCRKALLGGNWQCGCGRPRCQHEHYRFRRLNRAHAIDTATTTQTVQTRPEKHRQSSNSTKVWT